MDRRTAKMIRIVSEKTNKHHKSMKRFFYSLSRKEKHQMREEMKRFILQQDG